MNGSPKLSSTTSSNGADSDARMDVDDSDNEVEEISTEAAPQTNGKSHVKTTTNGTAVNSGKDANVVEKTLKKMAKVEIQLGV